MRIRTLAAVMIASTALSFGADAVAGDRWMIGLDGVSSYIRDNDDEGLISVEEKGDGGTLQVGYRFSPSFMVRLHMGGAGHATTDPEVDIAFAGGQIEGVFMFREGQSLRPYIFGGGGGFVMTSIQDNLDYEAEGAGITFGGGLNYMMNDWFSLHGSMRLEAVNWSLVSVTYTGTGGSEIAIETPIEESGFAHKVTFGIAFWL